MNASIYNQSTQFTVPTVSTTQLAMPKVGFADIKVGDAFLRMKGKHTEVYIKLSKKSALLMLNSKSESGEVVKFKESNGVLPLNMMLHLSWADLSEAGKAAQAAVAEGRDRARQLEVPRLPKKVDVQTVRRIMEAEDARNRAEGRETSPNSWKGALHHNPLREEAESVHHG